MTVAGDELWDEKISGNATGPADSRPVVNRTAGSALDVPGFGFCYLIFFLSGAAALIYEISWSRQIGLLFGHTIQSAGVVLAAYFAGLALGYLIGAEWSSRMRPLLGYGIAELAVASWACLIPTLLTFSESETIAAWFSNSSFARQTAMRAGFCFLLLLPATAALGATLPMMTEFLASQREGDLGDPVVAARTSWAYALNTAGALAGALSATFFLLVVVGVRSSSYLAAGLSAACGLAGCGLSWKWEPRLRAVPNEALGALAPTLTYQSPPTGWAVAGLSGFGILGLEVLYTRMFSLVLHNSTYTFGAVVAVFLASLAGGAGLTTRLQRRFSVEALLGWAAGLGALAVTSSVLIFVALTDLRYYGFGESFFQYLLGVCALIGLVVAPPITLLGMLLPLIWKSSASSDCAGRIVGRLTAVNTISAAAGALAASFLLLPRIGLWLSFVLLAGAFFATGCRFVWPRRPVTVCIGTTVFISLALLVWRSPVEAEDGLMQPSERLVRRWNSPYGWIDLVQLEKTDVFKVRQNLHYRFGQTGNDAREYRQAHIPLLLHERPEDVLFLGLGTGLTAGGAVPHGDVQHITAVELIPEVVEAARSLAKYNFGVVGHPKVEIRIDDARHYLLACDRRFDVIVSDLFVPWESQAGYLYTVEHYRIARRRLKPGGMVCQWLPLHQLGAGEFELIADSFASVFPVTTIWWGALDSSKPVVALVGGDGPLVLDEKRLEARLTALWRTTESSDANLRSAAEFFAHYQGDWVIRNPSLLNTDEHPRVEFWSPISNRDYQMLAGRALVEYYDDVLSRLPADAASLSSAVESPVASPQQRNNSRRVVLSGGSDP